MIDISDVNVGDRVKLTRENGDEATFTVIRKDGKIVDSYRNAYEIDESVTIEIVESAFEPYWGMVVGEPHEFPDYGGVKAVYVPTGDGLNWFSHPEPDGKKGIYYFDDDWAKRKLAEGWAVIDPSEREEGAR